MDKITFLISRVYALEGNEPFSLVLHNIDDRGVPSISLFHRFDDQASQGSDTGAGPPRGNRPRRGTFLLTVNWTSGRWTLNRIDNSRIENPHRYPHLVL